MTKKIGFIYREKSMGVTIPIPRTDGFCFVRLSQSDFRPSSGGVVRDYVTLLT